MSRTRALLATVLLAAFSVPPSSAQTPALTNADITRLVAMRVSDQTVLAVIHEATATEFDLSTSTISNLAISGVSPVVVDAMRKSLAPTSLPVTSAPGPQTLAGASATAAMTVHSWPLYTIAGSSSQTALPTLAAATPVATVADLTRDGSKVVQDEKWWRTRMGRLRDQLTVDKATCDPLAAKIRALQSTYDSYVFYVDGTAKINTAAAAVIETKLVDARAEQGKCVAKVALDQTAIGTAEEEARRLGVLPGWLRP